MWAVLQVVHAAPRGRRAVLPSMHDVEHASCNTVCICSTYMVGDALQCCCSCCLQRWVMCIVDGMHQALNCACVDDDSNVVRTVCGVGQSPSRFTTAGALLECMDAGVQHLVRGACTKCGVAQQDFDGLYSVWVVRATTEALQVCGMQDVRLLRARVGAALILLDECLQR